MRASSSKAVVRDTGSTWVALALVAALPIAAAAPAAPVAELFTYQGVLSLDGAPLDGGADLQFQLFDLAAGGSPVGSTISLPNAALAAGRLTAELDFGPGAFDGQARWLQISVRTPPWNGMGVEPPFTVLSPRQSITPAPYAIRALSSDDAYWIASGSDIHFSSGRVGIGTDVPAFLLHVTGGGPGEIRADVGASTNNSTELELVGARRTNSTAFTTINFLNYDSDATTPVEYEGAFIRSFNDSGDSSGNLSFWTKATTDVGPARRVTISSGGNVGIGVASPAYPLSFPNTLGDKISLWGGAGPHYGFGVQSNLLQIHTNTASADIAFGHGESDPNLFTENVRFTGDGNVGIGVSDPADQLVVGTGTHRFSVDLDSDPNYIRIGNLSNDADTFSMGSRGDAEIAIDTNSNDTNKVFRILRNGYGMTANAVELMRVQENGRIGMGTAAPGDSTLHIDAQTRPTALRVDSSVNGGVAIVANATGTTGNSVAGDFSTDSNAGTAVYARATNTGGATYGVRGVTSSTAAGAAGVRGEAPASTNTNYGVYGQAPGANAYGVYSNGRFGASGTKAFVIDHPLDPENKVLMHYSAESPDVLNIYSGNIALDARGEAWVALPDYFEAINTDPRYQLTAIGAPAPELHIAQRVQGNRFKIAGGAPGMEVSWEIKAKRSDRFVAQRGAAIEQLKSDANRGKYLDPALYGLPEEMGVFYAAPSEQPVTVEAESSDAN